VRFGTSAPAGSHRLATPLGRARHHFRFLPWIGFVFVIVNYGFIFREDRRYLHDLIADTRVVKALKGAPTSLHFQVAERVSVSIARSSTASEFFATKAISPAPA
jgi:hypothetical protein